MPRDPFQSIPDVTMYMKNWLKIKIGEILDFSFFCWKITFSKFVKDQKYSFSSKTDVFWRAMAKWWAQWENSENLQSYEVLDSSVRLIFVMFMSVWNLSRIKNAVFRQKLTFFEEIWQNGGYSENIQKICYRMRCLTPLYDLFSACLWPFLGKVKKTCGGRPIFWGPGTFTHPGVS